MTMASSKVINIKENNITHWTSTITGHDVTINYESPKKQRPTHVWFQMRDALSSFSGRVKELEALDNHLKEYKNCVISGFAGMGKTELARFYAWKYAEYFNKNVIWMNAEDSDSLKESLKKLATELDIFVYWNGLSREDNSVMTEIYSYFNKDKLLIVFDNVSSREQIARYLPLGLEAHANIYVLITSQNSEWGRMRNIHLLELPKPEAIELVVKSLNGVLDTGKQKDAICELVDLLQCMPLALQQAAAFIEERNSCYKMQFTVYDYINKFKTEESTLEYQFPHYSENSYRKSISVNTSIILKKLVEENATLSLSILQIISYFGPDDIDKNTFKPIVYSKNIEDLNGAFRILNKYSLVSADECFEEFNIHRTTQSVMRQIVKKSGYEKQMLTVALDLILLESEKGSIHASYLLKFAHENNYLHEYYQHCSNKKLFWFSVVNMESPEIAFNYLPIITDPNYFKDDDIITAAVDSKSTHLVELLIERGANVNTPNSYGEAPLPLAARQGNLNMVKYLVKQGANPNEFDKCNKLPLTCAIEGHHLNVVNYLLEAGTDLKLSDAGFIHHAAWYGHTDLIQLLLDKGVNINQRYIFKSKSIFSEVLEIMFPSKLQTALDVAASHGHLSAVKLLLNNGAELHDNETVYEILYRNHTDVLKYFIETGIFDVTTIPWEELLRFSHTFDREIVKECFFEFCPNKAYVLGFLACQGLVDGLKYLIERGLTSIEEYENNTLFHVAVGGEKLEVIKFLISTSIDINHMNDDGMTALSCAARKGLLNFVVELYKAGADPNIYSNFLVSPLFMALAKKHVQIVEFLIEHGANINEKDRDGGSFLQIAAHLGLLDIVCVLKEKGLSISDSDKLGNTALHEAALNNHVYVVKYLIKNGANIKKNLSGYTPLLMACDAGHLDAVECLVLHAKCDVNCSGNKGVTPLHFASQNGDVKMLNFLIENGADINKEDERGFPCSFFAALRGKTEILDILQKTGANIHHKLQDGFSTLQCAIAGGEVECIKFLVKQGAAFTHTGIPDDSCLMIACWHKQIESAKYLLTQNKQVNNKRKDGVTALQIAAALGDIDMVKLLISHGANINAKDASGDTALLEACHEGHLNVVSFLCHKGSSTNKSNKKNETPLHVAVERDHADVVRFLLVQKADAKKKNSEGLTPLKLAKSKDLLKIIDCFKEFKII